ncbi:MAG: hypothetical protein IT336_15145 [Thermomicrobiales bacterium]|nr:hypothetical protein [Thermomicrobiales bacterium]
MARRAGALCLVVVSTAVVAACGGGDEVEFTPTIGPTEPAAIVTPTVAVALTPSVEGIVWSIAVDPVTNAPIEPVERFAVDAEHLYGVVRVENLPEGAVLSASWTYNDAPLDGASKAIVPSRPYRAGYVEFHLTRSDGETWPVGVYGLSLSLDGRIVQSATVNVVET